MNTLSIILLFVIAILIYIIIFIYSKKNKWNDNFFLKNKKLYFIDFMKKSNIPNDIIEFTILKLEIASFFEKNKIISKKSLSEFAKKENLITPIEKLQSSINHHIDDGSPKGIDINNVTQLLHKKSNEIIIQLTNLNIENDAETNLFVMEVFKTFFIFYDFIELLQNQNWAKENQVTGIKFFLNKSTIVKSYAGSQNMLEFDKSIMNAYHIIKKQDTSLDDNLFLGIKFI